MYLWSVGRMTHFSVPVLFNTKKGLCQSQLSGPHLQEQFSKVTNTMGKSVLTVKKLTTELFAVLSC